MKSIQCHKCHKLMLIELLFQLHKLYRLFDQQEIHFLPHKGVVLSLWLGNNVLEDIINMFDILKEPKIQLYKQ